MPRGPGAPSAASALAGAPVVTWPVGVVADDGRELSFAQVVGPGGEGVAGLISALVSPRPCPSRPRLVELARDTPGGRSELPVAFVSRREAAELAALVDPGWVATVQERRSSPREALVAAGRGDQLEAALHVVTLVGTDRLPSTHQGHDVRAASGSQLWLLGGAVAAALAGDGAFTSWAELLACGFWSLGPVASRLIVASPTRSGHAEGDVPPKR